MLKADSEDPRGATRAELRTSCFHQGLFYIISALGYMITTSCQAQQKSLRGNDLLVARGTESSQETYADPARNATTDMHRWNYRYAGRRRNSPDCLRPATQYCIIMTHGAKGLNTD